ncbi:MAG: shikimate kinase [Helicobacteraceae bacterium]|nr:shikimate kinase [Helicobacteraceae bacterium]
MGVGKGSVARAVVECSEHVGIDTDDLIESMSNTKIKEIFAKKGEPYFRDLEKKVATWLESSVDDTLVSTGGGFFKVPNIKKIGIIIHLDSPFDDIYKRIKEHPNAQRKLKKRPLFQDITKAKELYKQRSAQYKKCADITIDVTNKSVEKIAKELLKKVKEYKGKK